MRKIIHIDMDAFYAAIEQRDNPELRGKPIVVGGSPGGRGVVATASYEARVFGIHSAMPAAWAKRACPHAIFVHPRMQAYREVSKQIMEIMKRYTTLVEPLSLDEAYLDVTENSKKQASATLLAVELRQRIYEQTQLTASAGVAPNKFLAKIASDLQKPDGLTVIPPDRVDSVLLSLPVGKIPGIGKKTEARMETLGIRLVGDLRKRSEEELSAHFGKNGNWYYRLSRGIDERAVTPNRQVKSVSTEDTFPQDLVDLDVIRDELDQLARKLLQRLERKATSGRTLTLKVTYEDFRKITRSKTFTEPLTTVETIATEAVLLLDSTEAGTRAIRLLGLGVSNLEGQEKEEPKKQGPMQLSFPFFKR